MSSKWWAGLDFLAPIFLGYIAKTPPQPITLTLIFILLLILSLLYFF